MVAAAAAALRVLETFTDFSFKARGPLAPRGLTGRLVGQLSLPYESSLFRAVGLLRQHV